ncbi:FGGY family carbohydrate kinase [Streptomyces sp. M19]
MLAWDPADGTPLSPAIVWQDRRAESVCAELADRADLVARRTGLVLDPYFSAPKMAWLRRNVTRQGVVTTTDTWLVHHLTGEFVTDVSTASRSLLLDLDTTAWDGNSRNSSASATRRCPRRGVRRDRRHHPRLRRRDTRGRADGRPAGRAARRGVPGGGRREVHLRHGAFVLANTGDGAVRSTAGLASSVAWRLGGRTSYCVDGQVYTVASAVRWLEDLGLISSVTDLDALAATDTGGVLCVPALAGLAARGGGRRRRPPSPA